VKVAGYLRCSTRRQDLEGQRRSVREWASRHDHELVLFEDDHTSGRKEDRRGIEALLAAAERGEFSLVAVVELSRIGRSIGFVHQVVERLSKLGVKVALVSTGTVLDYETLEGRALIGALALAADIEWKLIQERNARGRETIKARGVKVGRKPREVSEQALAALRERGLSLREIARELKVSAATLSRRLRTGRQAS
jgi:DNA invertase Pin-like site-specific DNA recombinase